MATTEYEPDATVMGREALRHGALRPLGVRVAVRGRLHLCLANVGKSLLLAQPKGLGASTGTLRHASLTRYLRCRSEPPSRHQLLDSGRRWDAGRGVWLLVRLAVSARLQMPAQGGGEAGGAGTVPRG